MDAKAVDALWDAVEEIETALGLGNPVGESRVNVRAADLRAALEIIDGHMLFCNEARHDPHTINREGE